MELRTATTAEIFDELARRVKKTPDEALMVIDRCVDLYLTAKDTKGGENGSQNHG